MTPTIARIQRVLNGHSERALVHAVDDAGLEYKLEVPAAAVRDLASGQGYVLVLSWSIHASPVSLPTTPVAVAATPAPTPTPTPATPAPTTAPTPSAVDAQFMALMNRPRASGPQGATPDQQLVSLLGVPSKDPT